MNILVGEDNMPNQVMLREFLERRGHSVTIASDGIKVLQQLQRSRPDLLLLDVHMPFLDGFEVVHRVRRDTALANLPVIAVTASAMRDDEQRAKAAGFDGYVTKPIDWRALFTEMERVTNRSNATRNNAASA